MCLGLFGFGFVIDILLCLQIQATNAFKNVQATVYTILLTTVSMASTWLIIKNEDYIGFACYVVGCGVGTYLTTTKSIRKMFKRRLNKMFFIKK